MISSGSPYWIKMSATRSPGKWYTRVRSMWTFRLSDERIVREFPCDPIMSLVCTLYRTMRMSEAMYARLRDHPSLISSRLGPFGPERMTPLCPAGTFRKLAAVTTRLAMSRMMITSTARPIRVLPSPSRSRPSRLRGLSLSGSRFLRNSFMSSRLQSFPNASGTAPACERAPTATSAQIHSRDFVAPISRFRWRARGIPRASPFGIPPNA